ncbi:MAG: ATP synthase F1 subunit gamma [Ignavibacteriaceae bacterium]|jgi:F-type H+-transporting ATPase subunit gamma|nr:ATP synthase F1 subunit gamma [Ignavibacteriaceae bacterium]MCU0364361.1 ATP synthase F1 subunit gamma [Ignavibacteriaceae bacterium]MCU0405415.1 ATP synthase F1 subunit gamma [Ignavibacteriaceae bacterium]MCU0412848.1 ATP synthase F1 subunit gamma [Ignavibacteriaceae bacterium]
MATLRDIKNRIVGVKSTQKITKAMKMIATAKLRGAQQRIVGARPYANKIGEMLSRLAADDSLQTNPFFAARPVKKICVVVITADRGLCGAFNTNIIREATSYINEEQKNENSVSVFTLGKKATEYFGRRNYTIEGKIVGLFSTLEYQSALQLYNDLVPKYLNGELDKIVLVYNEFVSMIQQRIVKLELLPIPFISENKEVKVSANYIFEPGQLSIFQSLIPKHLKVQVWRALLESNAAELSARMTAMDNATTNAQELIRSLNLKYNKERQAAITKEILEIVSGANALKAG